MSLQACVSYGPGRAALSDAVTDLRLISLSSKRIFIMSLEYFHVLNYAFTHKYITMLDVMLTSFLLLKSGYGMLVETQRI